MCRSLLGQVRSRLDGRADARELRTAPSGSCSYLLSPRGSRPLFAVIPFRGIHLRGVLSTSVVERRGIAGLCRLRVVSGEITTGGVGGAGALFVMTGNSMEPTQGEHEWAVTLFVAPIELDEAAEACAN
jgi:hypothetical protein